jgi:hypothetical protein
MFVKTEILSEIVSLESKIDFGSFLRILYGLIEDLPSTGTCA